MKKIIYTFAVLAILSGCINRDKELREKIQKNLTEYVKSKADKDMIIDTITINKIDTITPKKLINIKTNVNLNNFEKYLKLAEISRELYQNNMDLFYLSGNSYSDILRREAAGYIEDANLFMDSARNSLILDSTLKIQYKNCKDSVTLKYYGVLFSIKAHKTNNESADLDSCSVLLNTDLRVVNIKDLK